MTVSTAKQIRDSIDNHKHAMQYHADEYAKAKRKGDFEAARYFWQSWHDTNNHVTNLENMLKPKRIVEAFDNTTEETHKDFVTHYHDLANKAKKNGVKFAHKHFISIRDEHIGYYNEKSKNKLSVEGDNLVHRNFKGKKIELYPKPTWHKLAGMYE